MMACKYTVLKRMIKEWIDTEMENIKEAKQYCGVNDPGQTLPTGAIGAYKQVLNDIAELDMVVTHE